MKTGRVSLVRLAPVTSFLNTQAAVRATPDRPVDTLPRSIPDMPEFDGELWRDIYYSSFDGLTLYVRHYPAPDEKLRPVICLSGLSRNSRNSTRSPVLWQSIRSGRATFTASIIAGAGGRNTIESGATTRPSSNFAMFSTSSPCTACTRSASSAPRGAASSRC